MRYTGIFLDKFDSHGPVHKNILRWVGEVAQKNGFNIKPVTVPKGEIKGQIISEIIRADVVIACFAKNLFAKNMPENVIYEIAMRQTARKPIIIVGYKQDPQQLPFYVAGNKIIEYKNDTELELALSVSVNKPDEPDNEVWRILDGFDNEKMIRFEDAFDVYPINELWRFGPANSIIVQKSFLGGYSKKGREIWQAYALYFKMKILNKCLGVIIKGTPWEKGLMFQLSEQGGCIRPYRYIKVLPGKSDLFNFESNLVCIKGCLRTADIRKQCWYDVEIGVDETDIQIKLTNTEDKDNTIQCEWSREDERKYLLGKFATLDIPGLTEDDKRNCSNILEKEVPELSCGTIGFRNDGDEEALVTDIKVLVSKPNVGLFHIWP